MWLGPLRADTWPFALAVAAVCAGWALRFAGLPRGVDTAIGSLAGALHHAQRALAGCVRLAGRCVSGSQSARSTLLRYRPSSAGVEPAARLAALIGMSPECIVLRGDDGDGLLIHVSDETSLSDREVRRLEASIALGETLP